MVRSLIRTTGSDAAQVAADVGVPPDLLEQCLAGGGSDYSFTAGEVRALADYFGVAGGDLLRDPNQQHPATPFVASSE